MQFYKGPDEIINIEIDFTAEIGDDAVTPALSLIVAKDLLDGSDASAMIAALPVPAFLPATQTLVFAVQGGTIGHRYSFTPNLARIGSTGDKLDAIAYVDVIQGE